MNLNYFFNCDLLACSPTGNNDTVNFLIESAANVDQKDFDGNTALIYGLFN